MYMGMAGGLLLCGFHSCEQIWAWVGKRCPRKVSGLGYQMYLGMAGGSASLVVFILVNRFGLDCEQIWA